ncbi:outer membrane beta-barrel protein [Bizionia myxarmorum]|uniref:Outer membrane beta-barrel protein n=1 Tax=Bizionia myxarmorum TaxID=291186 RepID=A0A5D0RDP6_9FLAO|nr:outer membrane beta-barrel protein [Bizionia myxarmorum]TYB79086.1 outer membrane beta-barrel protein [Bizionia myxarmorum]
MYITFKRIRNISLAAFLLLMIPNSFAQSEASRWKAQFVVGVNSPNSDGFAIGYEGKSINFPTFHLGVQRMFKKEYGVKLDYGFNKLDHDASSPYFKINYSRINVQFVYDLSPIANFLPTYLGIAAHAGPGFSIVKPLSGFSENNTSFLNAMAGLEFHYTISRTLSVFLDTSYIYGFSSEFKPVSDGFGSFNGNLITATVGVSVSLSGCYYCD